MCGNNRSRFVGEMSGTLKPHLRASDDHELNVGVIKNTDRFFELHFSTIWPRLAISKMRAPSERLRARSVGVRRRVEINRAKSTPNSFALASSLPGGGFLIRCRASFSWSSVMVF